MFERREERVAVSLPRNRRDRADVHTFPGRPRPPLTFSFSEHERCTPGGDGRFHFGTSWTSCRATGTIAISSPGRAHSAPDFINNRRGIEEIALREAAQRIADVNVDRLRRS